MIIRILLLGAAGVEAGYGLLQFCGLLPSLHPHFPVSGSFYNPGPFGCFLALSFPLALAGAARRKGLVMWLATAVLLLDAVLLPISMSRTAWAAALAGSVIVFLPEICAFFKRFKLMIPLAATAAVILGILLFSLKEDSARGRMLIWKVAATAIAPAPFGGVGPEHVAGAYGVAQEAYFAEADRPQEEILVADAPEFLFNEYLQTALSYGWGAALLLIILIFTALFIALKNGSLAFGGCVVASMIVMGCSYPFQFPLSSAAIALIISGAFLSAGSLTIKISGPAAAIAAALLLCNPYDRTGINRDFNVARSLHKAGRWKESNERLMKLLPLTSDPMPLNIIGKNWQQLGRPDSARHYMLRAAARCPNRMYPHYLLMKLYADTSAFRKTDDMTEAYKILHMNVKVSSPAVNDMRCEARKTLDRHKHETEPLLH